MKKSLRRIALFFLVMAAAMGRNPAYACSFQMASFQPFVVFLVIGLNFLAIISLPVALFLWRVEKIKARYTVLPSLLAIIILNGALLYINEEMYKSSQAIARCMEMQRGGFVAGGG